MERPVWAEVDLTAIAHNVQEIKRLLKAKTKFCAVVKADAYGHGVLKVAETVIRNGADYLAVALLQEAIELREGNFFEPILILGYTPPDGAEAVVAHGISQTVFSVEAAQALSQAAVKLKKTAKVHIKVDTGMGRIGINPAEAGDFAATLSKLPGIEIEGVFSHFATADCADKSFAREQLARFQTAVANIEARDIKIPIKHIANSAATLEMPEAHFDMVRPGIILYGLWPSDEVKHTIELRPAMRFKARIAYIKEMAAGQSVSYGRTYFTAAPSRIATLPLGYADGWTRLMAGKAQVLIRGVLAPLVGRVCMDQCMVDVTGIEKAQAGDEALLFGGGMLPVEQVAAHMGTINYEVVCMVGKRVPRRYIDNTK
jgi:alanine racemase